jgi:hypothetical protein
MALVIKTKGDLMHKRNLTLAEEPKTVFNKFRDYYRSIPFWNIFYALIIILLFITMDSILLLRVEKNYEYIIYLFFNMLTLSICFILLECWIRDAIFVGGIISFFSIFYLNFLGVKIYF